MIQCKDFTGEYTCKHFRSYGGCSIGFMCEEFIAHGVQPVRKTADSMLRKVLEAFPGSKVIKVVKRKPEKKRLILEAKGLW